MLIFTFVYFVCNYALFTYTLQICQNWREKHINNVRQISGIAVNSYNQLVVFHRGDVIWNINSFDRHEIYQFPNEFILEDTVLTFDLYSGNIVKKWGNNSFLMPHGITIDHNGFYWLTDVALHQVFKYNENGKLLLTLGTRLVPGSRNDQFCKPTTVAVTQDNTIYVADGYCNSRVMVYDIDGNFQNEFMISITQSIASQLQIPRYLWSNSVLHSLTLLHNDTVLCISLREIFLISCHDLKNEFRRSHLVHRTKSVVYSIAYFDKVLYALGVIRQNNQMNQFALNVTSNAVLYDISTELIGVPHAMTISYSYRKLYVALIDGNRSLLEFDPSKKYLCSN